jgi:hypothetical protein
MRSFGEYIIAYPQLRPGPYEMHVRLALGTRNQDMVDTKVDLRIPEPRAVARRDQEPGVEKPSGDGALRARLEINHRHDTFKARVFLRNTTETDVTFTVSNHGVPRAVVPTFTCEGRSFYPAKFRHPPYRWRPLTVTIPAGKELFYDDYLLPYPTLHPGIYKLMATLRFSGVRGPLVLDMTTQLGVPESEEGKDVPGARTHAADGGRPARGGTE